MRVRIVALSLALAASVAGNGYLLATRTPANIEPARVLKPRPRPVVRPTPPPERDLTKIDRATLEHRLVEAKARYEQLDWFKVGWTRSIRSAASEERARVVLDKIFESASVYEVECRDVYCAIRVRDEDHAPPDWMAKLQSSPEGFGTFQIRSIGPSGAQAYLRDRRATPSIGLMAQIANAIESSTAIADCKRASTTKGAMTVTVSFDSTARRFRTAAAGALADTPTGSCLRTAVDAILAAIVVPSDVSSLPELPLPFDVR